MQLKYLLDTVIIIDHLNGRNNATKWLRQLKEGEAAISVITRAEVLVGTSEKEIVQTSLFLDQFPCLSLDASTADLAAQLRRANKWKLPDAFQAALAMQNQLILATRNTKDFSPKKHSFVFIPYSHL